MWIYEGKEIRSLNDIPKEFKDHEFIIYNITCSNGKEYIGQKKLFNKTSKKVSNRRLKEKGKKWFRRKKATKGKLKGEWYYYETIVKESNWVNYTGSSDTLNNDIKNNGVNITKYILEFCKDSTEANYKEHKQIMCTSAMEEDKFYNDYTQIKCFKKHIMKRVKKSDQR